MIVSDRLIYLQLEKTGCTHVSKLLRTVFGAEEGQPGKPHLRLTDGLPRAGQRVFGGVRDPWDWYVSMWAYGCRQAGALFTRLTFHRHLRGRGFRTRPFHALAAVWSEIRRCPSRWRRLYSDPADVRAFRTWLRTILSRPARRWLGDRYGESPLSRRCGYYSFRYLYLYTRDLDRLFTPACPATADAVREFDERTNLLDGVIRIESLADDLLAALELSGVLVTPEQRELVYSAPPTNTSSRLELAEYYDKGTVELVRRHEALIVDRYGYRPPV